MLEVTILKVEHAGITEARKLLPYIKASHIFSPEAAALSEQEATQEENYWDDVLANPEMNRTRLRKTLLKEAYLNLEQYEFDCALVDYLFTEREPKYVAERFSKQESNHLNTLDNQHLQRMVASEQSIDNIPLFLKTTYDLFCLNEQIRILRDCHIATNLDHAEDYIRKRWPRLEMVDTLRLGVMIGSGHYIEEYTTIPVHAPELTKPKIHNQLTDAMQSHPTLEHITPLLMEYRDQLIRELQRKGLRRAK